MVRENLNLNLIPENKKKEIIDDLIYFFKSERDEEIGIIAAEDILDHFLDNVGIEIYNKGIEDAKLMLKKRSDDLEVDLDSLKRVKD